jgi:Domain of unknown function (DUF2017)
VSEPEGQEGLQLPGVGFRAVRGGGASARFAAAEAMLLRNLAAQVAELVGGGQPPAGQAPAAGARPAAGDQPGPEDQAAAGDQPGPEDQAAAGDQPGPEDQAAAGGQRGAGDDSGIADSRQLEAMFALSDSVMLPDDPVLARLLPDAYPDDAAAAGEFRRYTESGLRSGKVAAARTVLDTLPEDGGRIRLSADEAQTWLRSLNDIRLALGTRLEVTEDREAMLERVGQDSPQAAGLWIYDWLTLLQETLVEALW